MNGLYTEYKSKLVSADEAVKVVKSGDTVHIGAFLGTVYDLEQALARRVDELEDVKLITTIWPYSDYPATVKADPTTKKFKFHTTQFGTVERKINREGKCWYIPVQFREQLRYFREEIDVDIAMLQVCPMDKHGYFNLGPQVADAPAIIDKAKKVIVEVNEKMPAVYGVQTEIHLSQIDYVVHGSNRDLPITKGREATEVDKKIANYIVEKISDGSTLQLGIGGLPNSVGTLIAESDIKDLSVHSEMFVDAFYNLYKAGKITGNKNLDKGKMVWTFSMGSKELYDFIDKNPIHHVCPVEYVNGLSTIAQIDKFVSVNSCLEVDLFGQVNSESVGLYHIGGNGGQLDFVLGCYLSKGGQSFLCTPSTFTDKQGKVHSQIKPVLPKGSIVTVPRQVTQHIVTEYGIANLKGKSTWQRAEALISIAHPDYRDELVKEAEKMGIWKNSSKIVD
ncbi:MAG: butyryl-CoA:acetate CoA-transferase [Syntrophomonadaceae bacterium]|nr:butyryl-CoA:acetate CoA-transferase [Syntrophomonadaceae bacterium]